MTCHSPHECLVAARVQDLNDSNAERIKASLGKLHLNLGHPTNNQLVRILKHGGASQEVLDAAKAFTCSQCLASVRPQPALPAQAERVTVFNQRVGVDVKYLNGWLPNQRIPTVNILDYASSLQIMVPLFQKENSQNIRQAIQDR